MEPIPSVVKDWIQLCQNIQSKNQGLFNCHGANSFCAQRFESSFVKIFKAKIKGQSIVLLKTFLHQVKFLGSSALYKVSSNAVEAMKNIIWKHEVKKGVKTKYKNLKRIQV